MTLADAGAIYAIINKRDQHNARCRGALPYLVPPLVTTWPCFTEAMYLAYTAGGWTMQKALWQLIQNGMLQFHPPQESELARMQVLMEKYRDTPMDMADASLVSAAEILNVSRIFTTDSDFYVYQIRGNQPFEVFP